MVIFNFVINLALITILGLLIAFSPMIVLVNVMVILKSSRPVLRSIVLMLGMAAPLIIVVWLASIFLNADSQISLRELNSKLNIPPLINVAAGLWLLLVGYRRWNYSNKHNGPKQTANLIMKHPPDKLSGLFVFAFVKSTLSVTNIFAILLLSKMLITNQVQSPLSILAVLWVILIGLLPFGVILYYYFFKHQTLELVSDKVDNLLNRNLDTAINIGLAGTGAVLCLVGAIHLFSR